ncbi:MAG: site-specific integrase [Pyrinomonadaceae bacterium]
MALTLFASSLPRTTARWKFGQALSSRMAHKIIQRWSEYARIGQVSPHDLRRSVITKLLDDGRTFSEVQMVTKHKDARSVQRYDHGRENLEHNPVNFLSWGEQGAQESIENAE